MRTRKIAINIKAFGNFDLSDKAIKRYLELSNISYCIPSEDVSLSMDLISDPCTVFLLLPSNDIIKSKLDSLDGDIYKLYCLYRFNIDSIERTDENLIKVIEELQDEANEKYSKLKIISIPDDILYDIYEWDGIESIHEKHRIWS